ncbi:MAG: hypothetical protein GW795_12955 [Cyanobacteria bacterium]|nr:hypothetical protein [Cyanobacteria bacterium CG_2015-16_32_12]NCO77574.1 hypothetical protein [Cyanobacteria bacterium CG_2015-22_32_23]NCQ04753.1 hypothetical protein [Cyanobacteria bacterium CG_2015-09_32_10]NCQ42751.1 hypothetical protein [Cyanobacteria bacterium CG_2015-04_32_10]NCS84609.1 hypothetical protein [Cyanobacteria bacterium CG_2015-02_32_10]
MKEKYCLRNWSEYNQGLKQRVSLTFWISEEALSHWLVTEKSGKNLVKNFERTLLHSTQKVNLCFIRLMLKRLAVS